MTNHTCLCRNFLTSHQLTPAALPPAPLLCARCRPFAETDYLFVKQIPASILPAHGYAQAFPYGYIQPGYPGVMEIGRRFVPGMDEADVPATGNAPVLMTRPDFETIIPVWADIVLQIENDTVAVQRLGWIRDMYAWSFAAAKTKITHVLPLPPHNPLMVQPPADRCGVRRAECCGTRATLSGLCGAALAAAEPSDSVSFHMHLHTLLSPPLSSLPLPSPPPLPRVSPLRPGSSGRGASCTTRGGRRCSTPRTNSSGRRVNKAPHTAPRTAPRAAPRAAPCAALRCQSHQVSYW